MSCRKGWKTPRSAHCRRQRRSGADGNGLGLGALEGRSAKPIRGNAGLALHGADSPLSRGYRHGDPASRTQGFALNHPFGIKATSSRRCPDSSGVRRYSRRWGLFSVAAESTPRTVPAALSQCQAVLFQSRRDWAVNAWECAGSWLCQRCAMRGKGVGRENLRPRPCQTLPSQ